MFLNGTTYDLIGENRSNISVLLSFVSYVLYVSMWFKNIPVGRQIYLSRN